MIISHPCTVFDKWRVIPLVDGDLQITEFIHTVFMHASQTANSDPVRVALVTGARRDIGAALAVALAEPGRAVLIHIHSDSGTRAEEAEAVAARIRDKGAQAEIIAADLADHSQTRQLPSTIIDRHGRLDVLVNNAAGPPTWRSIASPWRNGRAPSGSTSRRRSCWRRPSCRA